MAGPWYDRGPAASGGRHRGGFGGLRAVHGLRLADVEVTLTDRRNFHLFQPLSYQVATGALSSAEVCFPLRWIFRRRKDVQGADGRGDGFRPG